MTANDTNGDSPEAQSENLSITATAPNTYKVLGEESAIDSVGVIGRTTQSTGTA